MSIPLYPNRYPLSSSASAPSSVSTTALSSGVPTFFLHPASIVQANAAVSRILNILFFIFCFLLFCSFHSFYRFPSQNVNSAILNCFFAFSLPFLLAFFL